MIRPRDVTLLACREFDVAYGPVQVLFGVDFEVRPGEIVALLGPNGAGKSTLLKTISGLLRPLSGQVLLDGADISRAGAGERVAMGVVHVPEGHPVFPTLTVAEHFAAASWQQGGGDGQPAGRIEEVLQRFPRLRERWDQPAGTLSGGEQQQLALGMAFTVRPRLLMIDELSLGLAPVVVRELLEILRSLREQGSAMVVVEQSVSLALTLADRAYFMEKGQIRLSGSPSSLLARRDEVRSVFLAAAGEGPRAGALLERTRPATERPASAGQEPEPPATLEVRGLTKRFGGVTAVEDVSVRVEGGKILGLIGPNGAGKTTVLNLISGLLAPDEGAVVLDGVDVTGWPPHRRAAVGLGRSFQDARLFPSLTVSENIAVGLERHLEVRSHLAALLNLPAARECEGDVALTAAELIQLLGLGDVRERFVGELSTGERRIVELAMAIAHSPSVLVLDEPSSGVAEDEAARLAPLLGRIRGDLDCAMLVVEHSMPLITAISDEILALHLGKVLVRGAPGDVVTDPRVVSAYLGDGGQAAGIERGAGARAPLRAGRPSHVLSSSARRRIEARERRPAAGRSP